MKILLYKIAYTPCHPLEIFQVKNKINKLSFINVEKKVSWFLLLLQKKVKKIVTKLSKNNISSFPVMLLLKQNELFIFLLQTSSQREGYLVLRLGKFVADSSQQSLCVVAEDKNKCTQTTIVLWRKRDGMVLS